MADHLHMQTVRVKVDIIRIEPDIIPASLMYPYIRRDVVAPIRRQCMQAIRAGLARLLGGLDDSTPPSAQLVCFIGRMPAIGADIQFYIAVAFLAWDVDPLDWWLAFEYRQRDLFIGAERPAMTLLDIGKMEAWEL